MSFIINKDSASVEKSVIDIMEYLRAKPDWAVWKDTFETSSGTTIIELLAGLNAINSYRTISSTKEAYLKYGEQRSSRVAISGNLGYSVFRGRNAIINLTVNPATTYTVDKYEPVGSVIDAEIIALESTILNAGVDNTLRVVVGNIVSDSLVVSSDLLSIFRFKKEGVSDDLRLFLNGSEINYDVELKKLIDNKYVVQSNGFGSADVLYLNKELPKYSTGDTIRIDYIELNDLSFELSDISYDIDGVNLAEFQTLYQAPESKESITINAPIYFETQMIIRGREDYRKNFLSLNTEFKDVNARDFSAAVIELTYLKSDLTNLTSVELDELNAELLKRRDFGVKPPYYRHPEKTNIELDIIINLANSTTEDIIQKVNSIIETREDKFFDNGEYIDLYQIENEIENNSYVKTARVNLHTYIWNSETYYQRLSFISPTVTSDYIYQIDHYIKKSGGTEPTWPTNIGDVVTDNDIIWECIEDSRCNIPTWTGDSEYADDQVVRPSDLSNENRYRVLKRIFNSSGTEPVWPENIGDTIDDGEVIWMCSELVGSPGTWAADYNYNTSDVSQPTTANGFMYEVVGYRGISGTSEPTWPAVVGSIIEDGNIAWKTRNKDNQNIELNWNEYTQINQNITINS